MQRHFGLIFIWMLVWLSLCGLLVLSSISFAEEGKWTRRADMPNARLWLSTSVVNGKIYAIGGWPGFGMPPVSTVEEYNPVTDKWTKKADMLLPRDNFSTSVMEGKIYVIGGRGLVSRVDEYDPTTDTWKWKTIMPTPRSGLSTSVVNGKIYAIGGFSDRGFLSTVEKYDPATDKWTKKTDMPTARYGLSTGVVGRKIYAIGGEKVIAGKIVPFPTIEEYDPATDKWTKKTDMPTARYGLSTSVVGGKIYAIGGFDKDARSLSTMEEYDPVIDKWTKKTDMPTPRSDLSTSVMNGKIYAIGGTQVWPAKGLSTVEEYDIGFADEAEGIEAKEKLVTSWGKIKVKY